MLSDAEIAAINRLLAGWRQGDLVLAAEESEDMDFLHLADLARPLTAEAVFQAREAMEAGETESLVGIATRVPGLAVLTQTCDIVRSCRIRPFVELAPLVPAEEHMRMEIRKGLRPAYAWLPGAAAHGLVIDLDRVMTVEKAVLAKWPRTGGWTIEEDLRSFARALARKRDRFAFPDDFNRLLQPLRERIKEKHGKLSVEGQALLQIRQIRVRAAPSWSAPGRIEILLIFVLEDDLSTEERAALRKHVLAWCERIPASPRYEMLPPLTLPRDDLSARDIDESDQLDLDHLSG
jgi:hypothetical protein